LDRRFRWIAEAALKKRRARFVIDGEAVILGTDGVSDQCAAFGKALFRRSALCLRCPSDWDLRELPLTKRKLRLEGLLGGRPDGIFLNPFEVGAIGPDLFQAACSLGLEGLVSKRSDRP
jgi:bifunctional non-homologous end joining protein LigD